MRYKVKAKDFASYLAAMKLWATVDVVLENSARRFFVVEIMTPSQREKLAALGADVSEDRPIGETDKILDMIEEALPGIEVVRQDVLPSGIEFLNIKFSGTADIVYDPKKGYGLGVNTTCTPFCGPDVVCETAEAVVDRVVHLLRTGGSTYREDVNGPRAEFDAGMDKLADQYGGKTAADVVRHVACFSNGPDLFAFAACVCVDKKTADEIAEAFIRTCAVGDFVATFSFDGTFVGESLSLRDSAEYCAMLGTSKEESRRQR